VISDEGDMLLRALDEGAVLFLTVDELADLARCSRMTIYRLIHSGQIDTIRTGRNFRIPVGEAKKFLTSGNSVVVKR